MRGAAFAYGDDAGTSSSCPTNYAKITDDPTCAAAAVSLEKTYQGARSDSTFNQPSGCYQFTAAIFLNTDPVGGTGAAGFKPVCAGAHQRHRVAARRDASVALRGTAARSDAPCCNAARCARDAGAVRHCQPRIRDRAGCVQ